MKTCSRCSAVFFEPAYGRVCQRCLDREKEAAPSMWEDPGLFIHAPWKQPDPREQAKGLLAEAEKLLEEATQLDPSNAKARENLAQVRTIRSQVG